MLWATVSEDRAIRLWLATSLARMQQPPCLQPRLCGLRVCAEGVCCCSAACVATGHGSSADCCRVWSYGLRRQLRQPVGYCGLVSVPLVCVCSEGAARDGYVDLWNVPLTSRLTARVELVGEAPVCRLKHPAAVSTPCTPQL